MIKGFRGTSLVDYPYGISSVIFTGGCNLRCPYCYNRELVLPELLKEIEDIDIEFIIDKLNERKNFIDAVVITGGEPTIHSSLKDIIYRLKKTGLKIKIDTNGQLPKVIEDLVKERLVDFIALDVKTSPTNYPKLGGNWEPVLESIEILKKTDIDSEIRITAVPSFIDKESITQLVPYIKGFKNRVIIQKFIPQNTLDSKYTDIFPYPPQELEILAQELSKHGIKSLTR